MLENMILNIMKKVYHNSFLDLPELIHALQSLQHYNYILDHLELFTTVLSGQNRSTYNLYSKLEFSCARAGPTVYHLECSQVIDMYKFKFVPKLDPPCIISKECSQHEPFLTKTQSNYDGRVILPYPLSLRKSSSSSLLDSSCSMFLRDMWSLRVRDMPKIQLKIQ